MSHNRPYTLAEYNDAVKFNGSFGLSMTRLGTTMQNCEQMKEELLKLMPVRLNTHEVVPGPFGCRWCDTIVRLATGGEFPGEAHDPDCFAAKCLGRPVRMMRVSP